MVANTLSTIRNKVRKVTARPSTNQITDDQIDFYINTFYLYDFPEHLRLRSLQTNYIFVTKPNVEKYEFPVEEYVSLDAPAFIGGYRVGFYQDQSVFYGIWPKLNFIQTVGTGDGTSTPTLSNLSNIPCIPNNVTLSATILGESVSYLDNGEGEFIEEGEAITSITQAASAVLTVPGTTITNGSTIYIDNVSGMTELNGNSYTVTAVAGDQVTINVNTTTFNAYTGNGEISRLAGTINYTTGALVMDWGNNVDSATDIICQYIPYVASRPRDLLFFHNEIILRPIPDKPYRVEIVAYQVPTELLAVNQLPELAQWWQLLALGASIKIFEDSGELEQYQQYRPLLEEQLMLANRRTVKQNSQRQISTPFKQTNQTAQYGLFYDNYGS